MHNSEDVKINVTLKKQDKISIIIEDNGRGIKGEELNRILIDIIEEPIQERDIKVLD